MKKITINKSDEVAIIVEKIIEASENEVVLNVPRFSHIGESLSNFHLLKREADALEKKIVIESVDDHVVELAEMSGLRAVNPFFAKNKRQFSDIVAPKAKGRGKKLTARVFQSGSEEGAEKQIDSRFEELESGLRHSFRKSDDSGIFRRLRFSLSKISLPSFSFFRINIINRRSAFWLLAIIIFGATAVMAVKVLPKATVVIAAKTAEWSYKDSVTTQTSGIFDPVKMTIPNQAFSQKKNADLRFPATGRRQVEKKANGIIIVYNSYSSDPQPLIEQTRFVTPDGKLFRLVKNITVPAAKIVEGKIVPSSIEAEVAADQPGPEYNIGPVKLFTIPGFKGSPKYQAFYGESTGSMTGGFIGEVAYPTDKDVKEAKPKALSDLEENIKTTLFSQIPPEFKILDGASSFKLLQQKVNEEADQDGNFSVFTEAQLTIIGFKEDDVKELLARRAREDLDNEAYKIRSFELSYGLPRADFEKGILSFPVDFKGIFAHDIDTNGLAERLAGKSKSDSRAVILGLSGLDTATVSFWPFWVQKAPDSINKIKIMLE